VETRTDSPLQHPRRYPYGEVWKGNQLEPDSEDNRLVEEENRYGQEADRMGYYPCAMVKNYSLDDLPNPGLFLTYYSFSGDLSR
jgi:hypothetical protein